MNKGPSYPYMKSYYYNPDFPERKKSHLVRVAKYKADHLCRANELIAEFRSKGCAFCPEKEAICLDAHHLGGDKDFMLARRRDYGIEKIKQELQKCICVCANCHRKIHAGIIDTGSTPNRSTR